MEGQGAHQPMPDHPTVVIFGAQGMLGHALASTFADDQPLLMDRAELDLTDASAVQTFFRRQRPTLVINAAAYTDVDGAEEHKDLAHTLNATVVGTLAALCKEVGAVMVHYSTDYVFGGTKEAGYAEDDSTDPLNAYGRTKRDGERLLLVSGADVLLIRTSWLYGFHGKNFVDTMITRGQQLPKLTVVDDQHGKPTYTADLAHRTKELLERRCRGVHHATNEGLTTWFEFAKTALALAGIPTPIEPMSSSQLQRKAVRPQWSGLLNTKDSPMRPWHEALAEYLLKKGVVSGTPHPQENRRTAGLGRA